MQVVYRGHLGRGPHPEECSLRQLAARAGLTLNTFEWTLLGGYKVVLGVPDSAAGQRQNIVATIEVGAETLAELVAWVERYGRGEAWG